jgi:4-amino-4-deoxy-L-arabinose transferase-like glycosyltransferase
MVKLLRKNRVILLLILFFATLFRFYNLPNWISFGMDQEYVALIVKNIVTGMHFPLIGVNASDTGLYLGPVFIYFSVIPFFISSGSPLAWAFTASFIGLLTTYLVYKLGSKMFTKRIGLFGAFFYGLSFLVSFYDRQFWNPMPIPLLSLFIGYLLYSILNNKTKPVLYLAFVYGIAVQCHLSVLIFAPLIFWIILKKRKQLGKKNIIISFLIFILLQSPLLIFEFRHNFINIHALINIITAYGGKIAGSQLSERALLYLSTLGRFFWLRASPDLFVESGQSKELLTFRKDAYPEGIILVLFLFFIFIRWFMGKKRKDIIDGNNRNSRISAKLILSIYFLTIIYLLFYNRSVFEYYLLYLFPWIALTLGWSLNFLWQKKWGGNLVGTIMVIFMTLNLVTLFTATYSYSYKEKKEAINWVKDNIGNDAYILESLGESPRFGGYRYLFGKYAGLPEKSYMDGYFGWLYKDSIHNLSKSKTVLLSLIDSRNSEDRQSLWQEQKIKMLSENRVEAKKTFGRIQVYILMP